MNIVTGRVIKETKGSHDQINLTALEKTDSVHPTSLVQPELSDCSIMLKRENYRVIPKH